jgi:hypothetical protein
VVTLKQNRTGLAFLAVKSAAGNTGYRLAINDALAVEHNCDAPADQRDVDRLPLTRLPGRVQTRGEKSVNAAEPVAVRLVAEIIFDLNFIPAAQINPAVAPTRIAEFSPQLEVGKLPLG